MNRISRIVRSGAAIALAASGLAACATPMATRMPAGGGPRIAQTPRTPSARAPSGGVASGRVPGTMRPYQIKGVWYYPAEQPNYNEVGIGSWYGEQFHNRTTSNGEVFDMDQISAAHKTLPLPSMVEVTNLENGRKLVLRVNDRGPFVDGRIIDLSRAAAEELGYKRNGTAKVRVRYIGPAPKSPFDGQRMARAAPATPSYSDPMYDSRPVGAPTYVAAIATIRDVEMPKPGETPPMPAPAPYSPPQSSNPRLAGLGEAGAYRVQVAAFASRDNAERAASQLGQAAIEPMTRSDGLQLFRVIMGPAADEPAAWAMRDLAASQGFSDARVLRP